MLGRVEQVQSVVETFVNVIRTSRKIAYGWVDTQSESRVWLIEKIDDVLLEVVASLTSNLLRTAGLAYVSLLV